MTSEFFCRNCYDPNTIFGATFAVDADASFTNRAKGHANNSNDKLSPIR
jgi:hypothetical protein